MPCTVVRILGMSGGLERLTTNVFGSWLDYYRNTLRSIIIYILSENIPRRLDYMKKNRKEFCSSFFAAVRYCRLVHIL
jgi:hypothetical protein